METSQEFKELAAAMLKFQTLVHPITKDATNPHFKKQYASLSGIKDTINDVLLECGLLVTQHPQPDGILETMIIHADSGQWMRSKIEMPNQGGPQAVGSAITYARRYALSAILFLTTEDDDDGNSAQTKTQAAKQPATPPPMPMLTLDQFHKAQAGTATQIDTVLAKFNMPDDWRKNLIAAADLYTELQKEGRNDTKRVR